MLSSSTSYHKHKFNFRSTCCVFLGYSLQNKGYICLSNIGKLYVSHHVVFNEKLFLYSLPEYNFHISSNFMEFSSHTPSMLMLLPAPSHNTLPVSAPVSHTTPSISSETVFPSSVINEVSTNPPIINNAHPMITRSKAGVLKPKTYTTTVSYAHEPLS